MRCSLTVFSLLAVSGMVAVGACGGDGAAGPGDASTAEGGFDAQGDVAHDTPGSPDAAADAADAAEQDAQAPTPTLVAQFDKTMGQLPEGLWEVSPNASEFVGSTGTPITAWVPLAAPVTVAADGGFASFGALASGTPNNTFTLGVITDSAGSVYYAVAAHGPNPNPAPGIYKLPSGGGGTATAFLLGSAVTPAMNFANGLDFIGQNLFIADSEGVIYKISADGTGAVWSQDALLAPGMAQDGGGQSACGGVVPLQIGANGIVHDANNVYVTNTDYGRLIKIPINTDGSAGTAAVVREDCAGLAGADGLLIDPRDNSFIIAVNAQNKIVRVSSDGSSVTVLASGSPLATPASPVIDTAGGQRRLLVTNSTFFSPADAGTAGLVQVPLP